MIYLLPHTILHSAENFPDKIAFKCGKDELTYSDLANRMDTTANFLAQLGVKKGDRIGIYMNRSIETAIAIYSIMRIGAVYVPLDYKSPPKRNAWVIDDCQIRVVLTNKASSFKFKKLLAIQSKIQFVIGTKIDSIDKSITWDTLLESYQKFSPKWQIFENDLAYIMYTSGTTGKPKGIMHTHYSGLNYAKLSKDLYEINENDIVANHAPIHFDISTFGYFTAPLAGATTVIVQDAHTLMPGSLAQLIRNENITIWYSVPLALTQLIQNNLIKENEFPNLRWLLYGGEPFPPKFLRMFMQTHLQTKVSNVYGPAEVNQCTYYNLSTIPENEDPIPIGQVWNNTEMMILNEDGKKVSTNEPGELLISSITMMKGYWGRPELTADSLYNCTGKNEKVKQFYKTGDLVKLDGDGLLHFLGRIDHQIKVRGHRIELEEVESSLLSLVNVVEAGAYVNRQGTLDFIEAAIVIQKHTLKTESEIIQKLKLSLPDYAIPERIHVVEILPKTGTGKVDRNALSAQLIIEQA